MRQSFAVDGRVPDHFVVHGIKLRQLVLGLGVGRVVKLPLDRRKSQAKVLVCTSGRSSPILQPFTFDAKLRRHIEH